MPKFSKISFVVFGVAFLYGCELIIMSPELLLGLGLPGPKNYEPEIAIKPSDLRTIKTIAILKIPEPNGYSAVDFLEEESTSYGQFSFAHTTQAVLTEYLTENGFEIIEYSPDREHRGRLGLVYDYISLDIKGADAYLDVVPIDVGYRELEPHVFAAFRLVLAQSNKRLYAGSVQYGWKGQAVPASITYIESPKNHTYYSREALWENKKEAAEWLVLGIEAISLSIGKKIIEGKLIGLAENELVTGTYDQSLWAKALVEVEGDETKRNAKYIELRANQLFVDKDEVTTIVSAVVPTSIKNSGLRTERNSESTSTLDLTGTYRSAITSSSSYVLGKRKYKNLTFELKQDGDKISGKSLEENIEISGILNDDTVKFEIAPVQATGNWGLRGTWKISPDGRQLTGRWSQPKLEARGKWNLERLK